MSSPATLSWATSRVLSAKSFGICRITKGLHDSEEGEGIEFEKVERLKKPVSYEALKGLPELEKCEPLMNHQGSLFKLRETEYEVIRGLIDKANPVQAASTVYTKEMAMEKRVPARKPVRRCPGSAARKEEPGSAGPPGVGKTFVARHLAMALIGTNDPQRIEMIQFHQSYFIRGLHSGIQANGERNLRTQVRYFSSILQEGSA